MSKLLYITEEQLQEIIGNGSYLNSNDSTNEYRFGGAEISVNGVTGDYVDGNVEIGEPVITDKISTQLSKPRNRAYTRLGRMRCENYDRFISESNEDMTGKEKTFQLSQNIIDDIKQNLQKYNGDKHAPGVKRGLNIVKNGRISYDDGYRILDDIASGKDGDVLNTDGKLEREIRQKIDTAENISSNDKENKKQMGLNVIKSNSKTGMKGGAHTPKNNNTIGVTYF